MIDGGSRSIEGQNTQGPGYMFVGKFQGTDVYLGEIRTDDAGAAASSWAGMASLGFAHR